MIGVTENFRKIQDLLAQTTHDAGRAPNSVRLLAVSKSQPSDAVREVAEAGQRDFGENFVQEALGKMDAVRRSDLEWHFIGHLQSNKTRQVAERFQWVHTIDRLKIAERLSRQRPHYAGRLNVCLQVKVDPEEGKSGVSEEDLPALAQAVSRLPGLQLRGLMCIPAPRAGFDAQRLPFRRLRAISESLAATGIELGELSMGMSADFVAAIHEGATIVRIGSSLFGPRPQPGRHAKKDV